MKKIRVINASTMRSVAQELDKAYKCPICEGEGGHYGFCPVGKLVNTSTRPAEEEEQLRLSLRAMLALERLRASEENLPPPPAKKRKRGKLVQDNDDGSGYGW